MFGCPWFIQSRVILRRTCDADGKRSAVSGERAGEQLSYDAGSQRQSPRGPHLTTVDVVDYDDVVRLRSHGGEVANVAECHAEVVSAIDQSQVAAGAPAGGGGGGEVPRHGPSGIAEFDVQPVREPTAQPRHHRRHVAMSVDVERPDADVATRRQEVEAAVARVETCTAAAVLRELVGWSRAHGLGLENVSRPQMCGFGLGLEPSGWSALAVSPSRLSFCH